MNDQSEKRVTRQGAGPSGKADTAARQEAPGPASPQKDAPGADRAKAPAGEKQQTPQNKAAGPPAQELDKDKPKGGGNKQGGGNQQGGGKPEAAAELRPMAEPAEMKRRHWGLILSFLLVFVIPVTAVCIYLWTVAEDQYASTTGFTVRAEESGSASELLGGLASFAGASVSSDSDILYEFIRSQKLVRTIDEEVGLKEHFASRWEEDPIFALSPDATMEDLVDHWGRIARISYDQSTGLIEVRILAFEPGIAQQITQQIMSASQTLINSLNEQARQDAMRYAIEDVEEAVSRLKEARQALTDFRTRTQIVDPDADIQGRMGVMNNLQQQLAEALIEFDLLTDSTNESDPRVVQAQRRIEVIRNRIADERENVTTGSSERDQVGEDYPNLLAEYEGLMVDREFAEESYRAALTALEAARAKASRQSRYLATYIEPTLAETSEFPRRFILAGLAALFLLLGWSIMALVYYSIRDRN